MVRRLYIEALVWLLSSVFLAIKSIQLDLGSFTSPGPGFMPFLAAILLFFLSLILFLQAHSSQKLGVTRGIDFRIRAFATLFLILIYVFVLKKVGYILSTFCLMILVFKLMGTKRWTWILGEALAASLLSYIVFGLLLQLDLPTGIF